MKPLKVKKPTPAIGVRIRRPILSRHVRFSGLRRPKACQGEMTDNNGTVIHHIDAWEKSEAKSSHHDDAAVDHPLDPRPFRQPRFLPGKECWLMGTSESARPDSCTSSSRTRSDYPNWRASYCGKFMHSTASCLLRHSPPVQPEWHGSDRTTDDGQG